MAETLKEKTAKGLLWGGLSNGVQQLLNLAFGIVLARKLGPVDYGMVGMLTIFSLLASTFVESGFTNALAKKQNVYHRDYNAVFWFSLFLSFAIYGVLFFCAPLIAMFFRQPALVPLSRFLFLGFVISGIALIPNAIFYRNLQVRQKAIAQVIALVFSGTIGIVMACHGMSYWGIATQNVTYVTFFAMLMWLQTSWRPTFHFNMRPVREMFGFSSKLLVTNIFFHVNNNIVSVLLGRWYTRIDVGNFSQANKWNSMGYSFITNMISGVAMPVLASVGSDRARQRNIFRKMLRFTSFVSFPLMLGFGFVANEFITIAVTDRWLVAAHLIQLLCVMGAFSPIISLYTNMIISDGRSDVYMYGSMVLGLLQIVVLCCCRSFGVTIMVAVYVALYVVWLLFWHHWVNRVMGLRLTDALKDMVPFMAVAIFSLLVASLLTFRITNFYFCLAAKICCVATIYLGIMRLTNAVVLKESLHYLFKHK